GPSSGASATTTVGAQRMVVPVLLVLLVVPIVTVWLLGLETITASARWALVCLPALACLGGLGLELHRVPIAARFALPAIGMIGSVIAIKHDVVDVYGPRTATAALSSHVTNAAGHRLSAGISALDARQAVQSTSWTTSVSATSLTASALCL